MEGVVRFNTMGSACKRVVQMLIIQLILAFAFGCQGVDSREGFHVMFKGVPKIYHTQVYHRSQIIGSIQSTEAINSGTSMVTIRIDPEFQQYAGQHWAFYVQSGRLTAGKLNSSGQPFQAGDPMCGFLSKSAFNWFKVKTLLSDRISQAGRRAEKLHRRFTESG